MKQSKRQLFYNKTASQSGYD